MDKHDVKRLLAEASRLRLEGRTDAANAVESIANAEAMQLTWGKALATQIIRINNRAKRTKLTKWDKKINAIERSLQKRHRNRAPYKSKFTSENWKQALKRMVASHDGKLHRARQKNCQWWAWAESIASNNRKRMHTRQDNAKSPA